MGESTFNPRVILTGGPGAGKTTTLLELERRGFTCLPDSAREIIRSRLSLGLSPRPEPCEFARQILEFDIRNYRSVSDAGAPIFFDRGIVDSLLMLIECDCGSRPSVAEYLSTYRYNETVFFFPAWAAIFTQDSERDQTFTDSVSIADRIQTSFTKLGFSLIEVPFAPATERVEFIVQALRTL